MGQAREISATLDAVETPVQVQPGGQNATVTVVGAGRKTLRIRRFVRPDALTTLNRSACQSTSSPPLESRLALDRPVGSSKSPTRGES